MLSKPRLMSTCCTAAEALVPVKARRTGSAMPAMVVLWVMTTVVAPTSSLAPGDG